MARQIRRFSPHQTAKVFAVLMAVGTVPFVVLIAVLSTFAPALDGQGNPARFPGLFVLMLPFFYLVLGYVFTAIGCWFYNFMY